MILGKCTFRGVDIPVCDTCVGEAWERMTYDGVQVVVTRPPEADVYEHGEHTHQPPYWAFPRVAVVTR